MLLKLCVNDLVSTLKAMITESTEHGTPILNPTMNLEKLLKSPKIPQSCHLADATPPFNCHCLRQFSDRLLLVTVEPLCERGEQGAEAGVKKYRRCKVHSTH